jgi:hypothetical protein
VIGPFITSVLSVLLLFLELLLVFKSDFNKDLLEEPLIAPPDRAFYLYKASYYFNYF